MAEPEKGLPRPKPAPPVNNPGAGKIVVIVSGGLKITSNDPRVSIERGE